MDGKQNDCALCGGIKGIEDLFGYPVCESCKSKLGLLKDETIRRHVAVFDKAKKQSPGKPAYREEIEGRLVFLERDTIAKRIKLLHVLARLDRMT